MLREPKRRTKRRDYGAIVFGMIFVAAGLFVFLRSALLPVLANLDMKGWRETSCEVVERDIQVSPEGGFRIDFAYRYTVDGESRVGTRLDLLERRTDDDHSELDDRYPSIGERVTCWHDPARPGVVVLQRVQISALSVLSLVFVIAGVYVMSDPSSRRRVHRVENTDGRGRVTARNARGLSVVLAAIVWAACVVVIALAHASGDLTWSWLVVGLVTTTGLAYFVCGWLTRVELVLAGLELESGQRLEVSTLIHGPIAPREIGGEFIGREVCEWREGSSPRIDLRAFYRQPLSAARVPDDAAPSVDAKHQRIEWLAEVHAEIPWWPDVDLEIPLVVRGKSAPDLPPEMPAEIGAESRGAIALDGDRKRFKPGQTIAGTLGWKRGVAPKRAELRLVWVATSREVEPHVEIVGEVDVTELPRIVKPDRSDPYRSSSAFEEAGHPLAAVERRRFRFAAPDAPYTFTGEHVKIRWVVRLVIDDERVELPIEIG